MATHRLKEPKFKTGDLVRLKADFVEKVMAHKEVFKLYAPHGAPRDWIVSLCKQIPMRVNAVEEDHNAHYVIELLSDPRDAVWQQEWFDLVGHDSFATEDDLFEV